MDNLELHLPVLFNTEDHAIFTLNLVLDLADSHVRVGALGAASAHDHDHTTVSQRSSLLSPCPPLRLYRHES